LFVEIDSQFQHPIVVFYTLLVEIFYA
jgi:hypothetical protein